MYIFSSSSVFLLRLLHLLSMKAHFISMTIVLKVLLASFSISVWRFRHVRQITAISSQNIVVPSFYLSFSEFNSVSNFTLPSYPLIPYSVASSFLTIVCNMPDVSNGLVCISQFASVIYLNSVLPTGFYILHFPEMLTYLFPGYIPNVS